MGVAKILSTKWKHSIKFCLKTLNCNGKDFRPYAMKGYRSSGFYCEIVATEMLFENTEKIKYSYFFSVPPGRPLIHNERGILVETTLGPYNEGSKLRLTCSVSGGKIFSSNLD